MEQVGNPKAIILAGAPGAGKGFILSGLDLGNLKVLNVDNEYINLLKKKSTIICNALNQIISYHNYSQKDYFSMTNFSHLFLFLMYFLILQE